MGASTYANTVPAGQVPRIALIQKMKRISKEKYIFIAAPGGYGKTMAANQWLSAFKGKSQKITMREADNTPDVFYRRFAGAIRKLMGLEPISRDILLTFDRFLEMLASLPKKSSNKYLVLDDLHVIKNVEIIDGTSVIATFLPDYIRCCLISRLEPPISIIQTGLFEVISAKDFLLTHEECEWLSLEKDCGLNPQQVHELMNVTKGWAIYVSALLSDMTPKFQISGLPHDLSLYFEKKILSGWDECFKKLMISLSIPERLTPELVSLLTGEDNAHEQLEHISKSENTFLSVTDINTYSFHDVFRSFLLAHTKNVLAPSDVKRLHKIAGNWHYERGEYYEAARHFIQIPDDASLNRCLVATNLYNERTGNISVEAELHIIRLCTFGLTMDFINDNPLLLCKTVTAAYQEGTPRAFLDYMDLLYEKEPIFMRTMPELSTYIGFIRFLDFRISLKEHAAYAKQTILPPSNKTWTSILTHNIPFFHRSFRDFSEYHNLEENEIIDFRNTAGVMLGENYPVLEN